MKDKTSATEAGRARLGVNGHLGHCWSGANSGSGGRRRRRMERLSLVVSLSQARIFHRLTFSAQGCPQSNQSKVKEASRREEGVPLRDLPGDLQRPPTWNSSVVLDREWRRLPAVSLPIPNLPLLGMSVLFSDPVGHCGSSNKSVLCNYCVQRPFSHKCLGMLKRPPIYRCYNGRWHEPS